MVRGYDVPHGAGDRLGWSIPIGIPPLHEPVNDLWEWAWDRLNEVLTEGAEALLQPNPQLWWECGHTETSTFPFTAYASYSRDGTPGNEDVVVSVGFKVDDKELTFSTDLSRGGGEILAKLPVSMLALATDTASIRMWVQARVDEGISFLRKQQPTLVRELT
jgi:hypothetical protein